MSCCFINGSVVCELESTEKYSAIAELIQDTSVFKDIPDRERFHKVVCDREKIVSTGFGRGIAVAHGTGPSLGTPRVALGISRKGIPFDSFDRKPVRFLFLVANSPESHKEYLSLLSQLIRVIRDEDFRDDLISCNNPRLIEEKLDRALSKLSA